METIVLTEKVCNKCKGDPQPIENFGIQKKAKDGHNATCKKCINIYQKDLWAKKRDTRKIENQIELSPKEAVNIQNQLNGLSKVTTTVDVVKELSAIDEALLTAVRPFYYYMIAIKCDEEGKLKLTEAPSKFCQVLFPTSPYAGLQLFHFFIERNSDSTYTVKRTLSLNEAATEYAKLIALSSLIKEPSARVIADDIRDIRESMIKLEHIMNKFIIDMS